MSTYNYIRTGNGGWTVETPYTTYQQIGSHQQVDYNSTCDGIPIKYKEVRRLVEQLSFKESKWQDDKFLLKGIKNILMGK
jgi:hypothetical protein